MLLKVIGHCIHELVFFGLPLGISENFLKVTFFTLISGKNVSEDICTAGSSGCKTGCTLFIDRHEGWLLHHGLVKLQTVFLQVEAKATHTVRVFLPRRRVRT